MVTCEQENYKYNIPGLGVITDNKTITMVFSIRIHQNFHLPIMSFIRHIAFLFAVLIFFYHPQSCFADNVSADESPRPEAEAVANELALEQNRIGFSFWKKHDFLTALNHFKKAVQLDPDNHYYHANAGYAALQAKQTEEAARWFKSAVTFAVKEKAYQKTNEYNSRIYELYARESDLATQQFLAACRFTNSPEERLILETFNQLYQEQGTLRSRGQYKEALSVAERLITMLGEKFGEKHPYTIVQLNAKGSILEDLGRYDEAEVLYNKSIRLYGDVIGMQHPYTLTSINNLAVLFQNKGRYQESIVLLRQVVDTRLKISKAHHPFTLSAQHNLAVALKKAGKFSEAEPLFQEVITNKKSVFGHLHPETLSTQSELASLLKSRGRYKEAKKIYLETVNLREAVLGGEHPSTLSSMNGLAVLYSTAGDYQMAESLYQKTLSIRTRTLGETHPDTLVSIGNLGDLYMQQARYGKAEELFNHALQSFKKTLGGQHPLTLKIEYQIGILLSTKAQYKKAEEKIQTVFEIRRSTLGPDHTDTLEAMNCLAAIYQQQGLYHAAEPLLIDVYNSRKHLLGLLHSDTISSLNNLSANYHFKGGYSKAEGLYQEGIEQNRKVFGDVHPATLTLMGNLAVMYHSQGRFDKAEPLMHQVLESRKNVLGETHPDTLRTMQQMADLYESQGRFEKAEGLSWKTLDSKISVLGKTHPSTLISYGNLGILYLKSNKYREAEPLLTAALTGSLEVLGEKHPETLVAVNNYTVLLLHLKEHEKARDWLQKAARISEETLGATHPKTIFFTNNLAKCYERLQKLDAAEQNYHKALTLAELYLGESHPMSLRILDNLAMLSILQGNPEESGVLWSQHLTRSNRFLEWMLWGAGEETRQSYIHQQRDSRNKYLTYYLQTNSPDSLVEALRFSLTRKGLLLKISSEIKSLSRASTNPEIRSIVQKLQSKKQTYVNENLAGPRDASPEEYNKKLAELTEEINRLEAQLGAQVQGYKKSIRAVSPGDLLTHLKPDQVLVDFLAFEEVDLVKRIQKGEKLIALIVDPIGDHPITLVSLGKLDTIRSLTESFRQKISNFEEYDFEEVREDGRKLYQILWQPLENHLEEKQEIFVVPDNVLHLLPFAALVRPDNTYLIENSNLILLSSARDIVIPHSLGEYKGNIIFSSPYYDRTQARDYKAVRKVTSSRNLDLSDLYFSPLPGTALEGHQIKKLMEQFGSESKLYSYETATEQNMKQVDSPRVLHIATHGFFLSEEDPDDDMEELDIGLMNEDVFSSLAESGIKPDTLQDNSLPVVNNPLLRAGLALTGANEGVQGVRQKDNSDGILTAIEALSLDLDNTQLVVLSACETGIGEIQSGQGVYGLRRAFQEAGASSVLSTLWTISDKGTQVLMNRFYNLLFSGYSPQKALREIQIGSIRDEEWSHPYYWAPFVMVGKN